MQLTFLVGTGTVTGSKYLVSVGERKILVDCGLFQGYKQLRLRNRSPLPVSAGDIDAVVLTHAHLDHSGYLPLLVKRGFRGHVYSSEATRELCGPLLPDRGYLQEEEAAYANRRAIPDIPVFLNSPMAISATELYHRFRSEHRLTPEECDGLHTVVNLVNTVEESKHLNELRGPMIIISASGMATGGRVLHHLKAFAPDPRNTILFPGRRHARGRAGRWRRLCKNPRRVRPCPSRGREHRQLFGARRLLGNPALAREFRAAAGANFCHSWRTERSRRHAYANSGDFSLALSRFPSTSTRRRLRESAMSEHDESDI